MGLNLRIGQTSEMTQEQGTQALSQSPEATQSADLGSPSSSGEPTHFDDLIDENAPIEASGAGILSKDDFFRIFCGSFQAASLMTGLKSLSVSDSDGKAVAASGAIYDTIQDVPALRFLLSPQGKWFQRVILIGSFAVPMAQAVGAELAARDASTPKSGVVYRGGIPIFNPNGEQ